MSEEEILEKVEEELEYGENCTYKYLLRQVLKLYQKEKEKNNDLEKENKEIIDYSYKNDSLLDLYQKEKEKNKQLEKIIRIIRNKLKYKVIIEENGIYKPCKNLSKQEVYKDYEEIIDLLKADYCFMDNETAIKEILKENGVN